jgi:hypothetical protein
VAIGIGLVLASLTSAPLPGLPCSAGEEAAAGLRAAHETARRAHLEGDAELMAPGMADRMVVVSNGDLSVKPKAEMTAFFKSYFARVKYLEWSDAAPPSISISPDGRMGWMAVKVRARYLERAKPEAGVRSFKSSWIATYQRVGCEWEMTGIASAVVDE